MGGTSLRELPFLLLALGAMMGGGYAQRPVLNLFEGGADVSTIEVLIDTPEEYTASLVTSEDTENLVTDADEDIDFVAVKLNGGGQENEDIVLIMIDPSLPPVVDIREDGEIEIRIGTGSVNASAANFSVVLAGLSYRSNLSSSALSDPQRNVTITAYDQVGAGNTLTALLDLRVPNQGAPVFTQNGAYTASTAENSAVGTEISVTISAADPEGRTVTYSLSESSTTFAIDAATGIVTVADNTDLDYEDRTEFGLTIVASDGDPISPLTAEATLTIALTNVNDNDPEFDQESYESAVPENVEGADVITVSASDRDEDTLRYVFASTTTEDVFIINTDTGDITVRDQLDFETTTSYAFNVIVTDEQRSDTASVLVSVTDVADGRPVVLPLQKEILINLDEGILKYYDYTQVIVHTHHL